MKAIIIGGGVGGLTTAAALARNGVEAVIFERATDLSRIGVGGGISIWNNATRALQQVDLAAKVEAAGSPIDRQEFRTWRGEVQADWPLEGLAERLGAPAVGVLRSRLHPALAGGVDEGVLQLGAECTGLVQDDGGVTATLAGGREERGDFLVGADGINSVIRQHVGQTPLRYAGYAVWRGVATPFNHDDAPFGTLRILQGRGAWFGFFHVGPGEVYWFGYANTAEGSADPEGGRKQLLLDRFRGWSSPVEALIEATDGDTIWRNDIFDREWSSTWSRGRVTLLGDAAHPMTPNVGQGACQAIEDAIVLSKCVARNRDVPSALRAYEAARVGRTAKFHKMARRIGVAGRWENPVACWVRDRMMTLTFTRVVWKQHEKDMSYEV